ncbi:hypothetical protein VCR15J2_390122 [Vibrio coralliirubri]|uniref:helix-turn-helix transcriptional regulator n=1 Tax=Vibrio coralliirubri TaxID=1516159 RepID=UPI000631918C|nr:hypothetical protein VCR15J2_390122 [Vibrio coralliirubri]
MVRTRSIPQEELIKLYEYERSLSRRLLGLGEKIKVAREANRYSQETIAECLNVSRSTVSAIERGKSTPSLALLLKISYITNRPLDWFFDRNIDPLAGIKSIKLNLNNGLYEIEY